MIPIRPANGILRDLTGTVRMLVDDMLSDDCRIRLDEEQYRVLLRALDKLEALGDVGYQLHDCVDTRPGHLVRWDSAGADAENTAVDQIMRNLIHDLGFVEEKLETVK